MRPQGKAADIEGLELLDSRKPRRSQYRVCGGTLQRECRDLRRDLGHLHVEADRRIQQPVDLTLRRAQAVFVLAQPEYRSIVEHMTRVVAPDAVGDPVRLELGDIAGHEPIEI